MLAPAGAVAKFRMYTLIDESACPDTSIAAAPELNGIGSWWSVCEAGWLKRLAKEGSEGFFRYLRRQWRWAKVRPVGWIAYLLIQQGFTWRKGRGRGKLREDPLSGITAVLCVLRSGECNVALLATVAVAR